MKLNEFMMLCASVSLVSVSLGGGGEYFHLFLALLFPSLMVPCFFLSSVLLACVTLSDDRKITYDILFRYRTISSVPCVLFVYLLHV